MSAFLRLTIITATVLLFADCTNCEYLAYHPVITSATGQKLCARHHIPLVTVHGYQNEKAALTLYHWAGMNRTVDYCNPNRVDPQQDLEQLVVQGTVLSLSLIHI